MLPNIMKWTCMAALLMAALSWRSDPDYDLPLDFIVCLGAIVVIQQALRSKDYFWAAGFLGIALLFNPVVPIAKTSNNFSFLMLIACFGTFAISIPALKTRPLLSSSSITGNRGSDSL